jgi:crotonobetainyl-CoA:carnitine CoA-transferase CaiB-like acyl-CoA transferase
MTLDLKSDRGKEVLWRLVDVSHVLVENFRPGPWVGWALITRQ